MIAKYRKKPVVIEAVQFDMTNQGEVLTFVGDAGSTTEDMTGIKIKTLSGEVLVVDGDYIIKGVSGEFYPCKLAVFNKTYIHRVGTSTLRGETVRATSVA